MSDVIARLAAIVGEHNVILGEEQAPFLTDWLGKYRGSALAVVRPGSVDEVSAVMALCAERDVPVVPQGGNTSLSGGATPDRTGEAVVLSLARMNRVRAVDPVGNTITVDAGIVLANVHGAASAADRFFPLSLGAEGSCTIGGNLAANAGGVAVLRYGTMRELTLGLEVVLSDGRVWDGLTALRKDNTGYALRDLFIGSEGTLGVITGAVLKLFPAPRARATAFVAVQDVDAALALLSIVRARGGDRLTAFEFMTGDTLALILKHVPGARLPLDTLPPAAVLMELSDTDDEAALIGRLEEVLASTIESGLVLDGALAQDGTQSKAFWRIREGVSEALVREGVAAKHDVSVPTAALGTFVALADAGVKAALPGVRPIVFGHLGDGNLHYNLLPPLALDKGRWIAEMPALTRLVHDETRRQRGSISAEHGIGQLRVSEMERCKSPIELDLMASIKALLDPRGRLNPGKLLPGTRTTTDLARGAN
ncbi:FAD-binding oxidoreductase [Methylobacterium sp. SyP6R]|uniref:FAD-binding oxidoreductase n=1 Tax=Methylobacterium sp. SyP6R TaxID=2718876 RepID=UPI001F38A9D3|nr:FAD-binding oxidoreductase [Methylobacterium sp. SyP6R]MCF4130010.1 FAD-binding oxidoreductase [Methylobacterium sp. SyP6R]